MSSASRFVTGILEGMRTVLNNEVVGRRLRETRETFSLNASQFAAKAGITQNAYSQYETGKRLLTITAAMKLCDEFRITLDWLYRGESYGMPSGITDKLRTASEPQPAPRRAKGGRR